MKRIDSLGRIIIPKEIRQKLEIKTGDAFDISVEDNKIVIAKDTKKCASCGTEFNLAQCGNVILCIDCAERISENIKANYYLDE